MVLGLATATLGCSVLVEINPEFNDERGSEGDGAEGTGGEGHSECPEGMLDCDEFPGCESSAEAVETCGSCSHSCVVEGQVLSCEAGTCVGTLEFPATGDVTIDESQPDTNLEGEVDLWVRSMPRSDVLVGLPDLTGIPLEASVESASLEIAVTNPGTSRGQPGARSLGCG